MSCKIPSIPALATPMSTAASILIESCGPEMSVVFQSERHLAQRLESSNQHLLVAVAVQVSTQDHLVPKTPDEFDGYFDRDGTGHEPLNKLEHRLSIPDQNILKIFSNLLCERKQRGRDCAFETCFCAVLRVCLAGG